MGLTDLKKNSTPSKSTHQQIQTTQLALDDLIDDFINDASRYAIGEEQRSPITNKIIELNANKNLLATGSLNQSAATPHSSPEDIFLQQNIKKVIKGDAPFRKATFTLSESAIAHLAALADDGDVAKSKLIRFLIEHFFSMSPQERREIEKRIIVE